MDKLIVLEKDNVLNRSFSYYHVISSPILLHHPVEKFVFKEITFDQEGKYQFSDYSYQEGTLRAMKLKHLHSLTMIKHANFYRVKKNWQFKNSPESFRNLIFSPIRERLLLELTKEPLKRKELIAHMQLPRTTIYDNLDTLIKLGLVVKEKLDKNQKRGRPWVFFTSLVSIQH